MVKIEKVKNKELALLVVLVGEKQSWKKSEADNGNCLVVYPRTH